MYLFGTRCFPAPRSVQKSADDLKRKLFYMFMSLSQRVLWVIIHHT